MNRKPFPFEKLDVWQGARKLVVRIYEQTRKFPKSEMFSMSSQLNRASLSVANNLAEGSARASLKDQAHFSNQSYGSLMEVASDVMIANDLGFMETDKVDDLLNAAYDLGIRIHNLRESQLRRAKSS